jgi:hypothetical protein
MMRDNVHSETQACSGCFSAHTRPKGTEVWPLKTGTSCIAALHDAFPEVRRKIGSLIIDSSMRLQHKVAVIPCNHHLAEGASRLEVAASWQPAACELLDATTGSCGIWCPHIIAKRAERRQCAPSIIQLQRPWHQHALHHAAPQVAMLSLVLWGSAVRPSTVGDLLSTCMQQCAPVCAACSTPRMRSCCAVSVLATAQCG